MTEIKLFSTGAEDLLMDSKFHAQLMGSNQIHTEHILSAAGNNPEALEILNSLGIDKPLLTKALSLGVRGLAKSTTEFLGFTPRGKKVLELAINESKRAGRETTEVADLMMALIQEGQGIAAGILMTLGVDEEKMKKAISEPRVDTPSSQS